jgi:GNAT superfamily N-acetyltransferase
MTPETLEESILWRLCADALHVFYSRAPERHARSIRDVDLVTSGEPVTDLNYLMIGSDSAEAQSYIEECVDWCDARSLPFATMVTPEAAAELVSLRERLALDYVTDWPLMVCPGSIVEAHAAEGVAVRRVESQTDYDGLVDVLAGAYSMPVESVRRAIPLSLFESPSIEAWVAELDGQVLSSVTATWHGEVVGIWAMGTLPAAQRRGVGKALLSTVMDDCHRRGGQIFFLGATPAGFTLYETLGYRTVFEAQVWVRGETSQA